jgi:hypothetical protein
VRSDVGLWEAGVRNYKPPAVMVKKIPIDNVGISLSLLLLLLLS